MGRKKVSEIAAEGSIEDATLLACRLYRGKWAHCSRSRYYRGPSPPAGIMARGEGWEPALERTRPVRGYEYALAPGTSSEGGPGASAWQYYRVVRRPIGGAS